MAGDSILGLRNVVFAGKIDIRVLMGGQTLRTFEARIMKLAYILTRFLDTLEGLITNT